MVAADEYGRFLRGVNGYPQLVTASGLVEGNPAAPIAVPRDGPDEAGLTSRPDVGKVSR